MGGAGVVLLIAAAAVTVWWVDVRVFHPWKDCPRCESRRRLKGWVPGTHGDCGKCGTTGRVRRFGAGKGK